MLTPVAHPVAWFLGLNFWSPCMGLALLLVEPSPT